MELHYFFVYKVHVTFGFDRNVHCNASFNLSAHQVFSTSRTGVAEWFTTPCLLPAAWRIVGSSPKPPTIPADMSVGMRIKKGSDAMLTPVQSAGVVPEVNLRNPLCAGEEAHREGNPPWF